MKAIILAAVFIAAFACEKESKDEVVGGPPGEVVFPSPTQPIPPPIQGTREFVSFDSLESSVILDLNSVNSQDRINTRYLILCDKFNEKTTQMEVFRNGVNRAINQLSTERDLKRTIAADPNECIQRIDLTDYNLTRFDWRSIEESDPFKLESFTTRGLLIKQLTQTRRAWIHANNFINVAHNNDLYYQIMDIPSTLDAFFNFAGVNIQADFDNFDSDLFLMGFFGSPISLQKNRLLIRLDADDGPMWGTYDTLNTATQGKNLFQNPFPVEARSFRVFDHDGQEWIGTLPNGLHFYALFDGAEKRIAEAPINLVIDVNAGGLDPVIRNSLSCMRCHNAGAISTSDQIRAHIDGNPEFDVVDSQLGAAYFRPAGANDAAFRQDQDRYKRAMSELGINTSDQDPVNSLTDTLRNEMNLNQIASFFFLQEAEFTRCLEGSSQGREQIGQLLNGGTISLDQLIQTTPILIRDCNLFRDDIDQ